MKLGLEDIDNFKIGTDQVDKIMLGAEVVWQLSDSVDWDLDRMVYKEGEDIDTNGNCIGLFIDATGTRLFYSDDNKYIYKRNLSTPYSLSSMSSVVEDDRLDNNYVGLGLSEDGLTLMTYADSSAAMAKFLSESWYISNIKDRPYEDESISSGRSSYITRDGRHFVTTSISGLGSSDRVVVYNFSTPWDVSTISEISNSLLDFSPYLTCINEEGTIAFIHDGDSRIRQYSLSTPFDYSTITDTGKRITTGDATVMTMSADGKHLYYTRDNKELYHYEYQ